MPKTLTLAAVAALVMTMVQPTAYANQGSGPLDTVVGSRSVVPTDRLYSTGGRTGVASAVSAGQALSLASAQRAKHGLQPLKPNRRLQRAAQRHANWMARNGVMSHQGANGSQFYERVARAGYRACFTAENVALGQRDAQSVVRAWMNSPGHRRNMLDRLGRDAAVAKAVDGAGQTYWAMLVAKPC